MYTSAYLENDALVFRKLFADGSDAVFLYNCCGVRGIDALAEAFELIVLLFFTMLFFVCVACACFSLWRDTALLTVSCFLRICETLLESGRQEAYLNLQAPCSVEGAKTRRNVTRHFRSLLGNCSVTGIPNHGVRHLAVIMDGNRRFGRRTSMNDVPVDALTTLCDCILDGTGPPKPINEWRTALVSLLRYTALDGHRRGGEKLIEFIDDCLEFNIQMLTVYAFSTENWERTSLEVNVLMALFYFFFERIQDSARRKGIFIRFISPVFDKISPRLRELMRRVEEESRRHHPRRIVVNVCVSYSGREEVLWTCNRLLQRVNKSVPITNSEFMSHMLRSITQEWHEVEDATVLADRGGAEPQVLLRTSGEQRLSNFLLYECAYTEFVFIDKTWPEVDREDLIQLLLDYSRRGRRHGK
ncbi:cis-prenyltransferase [Trypanosoma rangeli]|uniref:Cis-prenyltransferase n=1 Tax=Trypanosoma rangeli TaxID=5698 RepID=A0A422NM12_TRYRA|nr:cis-prenyltransferase [Trypanosoma rangeli]RNF06538.1 cis-prenyltransferase [Trypanosoma rangeli]|eukprot:RNF06538.1 cis-prenyltransferase [Trypanosoma rangeli]